MRFQIEKSMIEISVIIPVYNSGALIDRCLDSVFGQIRNFEIEVILVDDGSTDDSVELIRQRKEQDSIRLFRQVNSGPSKARNKGIAEARGRYLAFIDADDYWHPEFLLTTSRFLDEHPECIAVSVAQTHLTTSGRHESPKNWATIAPTDGCVLADFYSFWAQYNHVCTGSILIRTAIAKDSEGQREDLRICEDLEYWALLATYGKIGYLPKLLFVSDGSKVTDTIGWVEKHLPRWNAAVTVDEWQRRIVAKKPELLSHRGFIASRGRIAQNLAYCIMMSKRFETARDQIRTYGCSFPNGKMKRLLELSTKNTLLWWAISRGLVYREYHRQ